MSDSTNITVHSGQEYLPSDSEALVIGELYRKARASIVESVRYQIECGMRLIAKKESMSHGEWLPWLRANADVLGFSNDSTARRLMQAANRAPAHDLSQSDAIAISRETWGHEASHNHRAQGTGENEWYTPKQYIDAARKALVHIDLDPASSDIAQRTIKAKRYYSKDQDGLTRTWEGRVWLNPPYAQPEIQQFVEKLVSEVRDRHVTEAILLTHNYTDTEWFHIAASACALICFTRGRIKFVNADGEVCAPTQGQAFFYYGKRENSFRRAFEMFGFIR